MIITRKEYETREGYYWAFRNDDGQGGVRFSCRQGELEETILELLTTTTQDFTILQEI